MDRRTDRRVDGWMNAVVPSTIKNFLNVINRNYKKKTFKYSKEFSVVLALLLGFWGLLLMVKVYATVFLK